MTPGTPSTLQPTSRALPAAASTRTDKPPTAAAAPKASPSPAASDGFQTNLQAPTQLHPIVSHLQLQIEDKDGLAQFGQRDISAKVSGDIQISPAFLLGKLAELKGDADKRFDKPRFDTERRQYVISGTAINKILGLFDIGFEIRLGVFEGQLAFRVDSGLKRGSIYEDLSKMLKKEGLVTVEKDGLLFIKPEYKQPIQLPALGEQPARIDKLGVTPDNLKFEMGPTGQIKLLLKQLPVELSSETGTQNPLKAKPDTAQLQLDLGLDGSLKPLIQIRNGQVQGQIGQRELSKYLPESSRSILSEQLGTALTVGLTGLQGQIRTGQSGLILNTSGQVKVASSDSKALVSAGVRATLQGGDPVINAQNAQVQLQDGTRLSAAGVDYDGRSPGLQLKFRDLDGQIQQKGLTAEVKDLSGSLTRSENGPLKAAFTGQTQGHVDQKGLKADFSSTGSHQVTITEQRISAEVQQADLQGHYQPTAKTENGSKIDTDPAKPAPILGLKINSVSASGSIQTPAARIEAQASQGSLQVELGQDVSVSTTARMVVSAQGEKVKGQALLPQGASMNLNEQGDLQVKVADAELQGGFDNPGKLKVSGQVSGDLQVKRSAAGKVQISATDGAFDAHFALKDKVKVDGKGQSLGFEIDAQENISLDLGQTEAKTEVTAGKTKLKAETKGTRAQVSVIQDDVTVQTTGTRSKLDINVNQILKGSGTAGDVTVKVDSDPKGDDIRVTARKADIQAKISNKKGNLKLDVDAQAEVQVHVDRKENVTVSSKQAQSKVDLQLTSPDGSQEKIRVKAQGKDFKVSVKDGDQVGVELQKAGFTGRITPNGKMAVDVASTAAAPIRVDINESTSDTEVGIHASSPVTGSFALDDKIAATFTNPSGFEVQVKDKVAGTDVHTQLKSLELKGQVKTPEAQLGVGGKGNFDLDITNDQQGENVQVRYDGHLLGDLQAQAKGQSLASGRYGLNGKVQVDVRGDDVDVQTHGSLQGQLKSAALGGVGADLQVNGQSVPIRVQIKDKNLSVKVQEGGQIQVRDLKQLKLGQPDPKLAEILDKLESQNLLLTYKGLEVEKGGASAKVQLATEPLKTAYGSVNAEMALEKAGEHVYVTEGSVGFEPNLKFYELIQAQINEKYNIRLSGTPSFANGELKLQGEIRSKIGLVQWADFSIKARVIDNKLVFDLDKAQILKVIGKGTVGDAAKALLSKTDIDVFRKGPGTIEIALADIVKDLALTQGVNFTDLKLVENRFEVGFRYNSQDLEIAKLAKKQDLAGLKSYLKSYALTSLSAESISTAFQTYLTGKDTPAATQLLLNSLRAYGQNRESGQLERALLWMSKNQTARKQDLDDDIALEVLKQLQLDRSDTRTLVENLPVEVVRNLADNLDKTISQGGGMSWIRPEERTLANRLRALKGLPLNNRFI